MQPTSRGAPVGEQLGRRQGRKFFGTLVDEARRVGGRTRQHVGESGLVGHRDQGDAVGPQQVSDLVRDGPAGRGRRVGPALGLQRRDQGVERLALGAQVLDHRCGTGHRFAPLPAGDVGHLTSSP